MKLFYDEQLHRMECLGHELVPFDDIYCQMCDLVGLKPMAEDHALQTFDEFRIDDFLNGGPDHMQLCGNFFNMLFNLNKFVAFEQRDPFLLKQQVRVFFFNVFFMSFPLSEQNAPTFNLTPISFFFLFSFRFFFLFSNFSLHCSSFRQRTEGGQLMTLWARFAAIEYARLAMEEEMREQEQVQAAANGGNNGYNGW